MKKTHRLGKDILIVAVCDLIAVTLSMLVSMLIVHAEIIWDWDLLYWYLCNLVTVGFFYVLFRLYSMSLRAVGIIDSIKMVLAGLCILAVNVVYIFFFDKVCDVRTCSFALKVPKR